MLSEEQRNGGSATKLLKSLLSTRIQVEAGVEEEAVLVAVQEIRTSSNNKKTSPMEEDVVVLEAGGVKEAVVHGKGTSK